MLAMFLLGVTCTWAAIAMVFNISLYNFLLGVTGAFFFLRGFELADKINKFGSYNDEEEEDKVPPRKRPERTSPTEREFPPEDEE